jgi:hypothetical protein
MNGERKRVKIGRNDPCPCGSGKKYKKCHGGNVSATFNFNQGPLTEEIVKQLKAHEAAELQRQQQQGLGRPIVSAEFHGFRFVAVRGRLHYSNRWKTFHDFLHEYIKIVLDGAEWGNNELKKPAETRHPLLNWYETAVRYQNQFITERGKVHAAPMTGAVTAYLRLASDLYLLAHNAKVQEILIKRLKQKDQFYGAYYETYVAARLIQAGFEIEFEDETDSTTSHCEFTATFTKTGNKFSVEAKTRGLNKISADVGNQLYAALKKDAKHMRAIFIEANIQDGGTDEKNLEAVREVLKSIRSREDTLTIDKQPAPPAYVIVTNNPHQYNLHGEIKSWAASEGFKIPDFKIDFRSTLHDALKSREKHIEMESLMKSMREHHAIPSTFDGDNPDLAFGKLMQRMTIGEKYKIVDEKDGEVMAELVDAVVMESKKSVCGFFKLPDGRLIMGEQPLSDEELAAYKRHPDTFFGVVKKHTQGINDPLQLFDWFYNCYRNTPKERLLELMKNALDHERLKNLSQDELAKIFCERNVEGFMAQTDAFSKPKIQI